MERVSVGVALNAVVVNEKLDSVIERRAAARRLFTKHNVERITSRGTQRTVDTRRRLSTAARVRAVHQTIWTPTRTTRCLVAQWLGPWIRDREVASSTPGGCVSE